jgi:acetoin:2,6-dichlorophenolindophenol oxidoreductase subunit beta
MPELRFGQALNLALKESLEADPTVWLLGEDIGRAGGAFGVTRGLLDAFGPGRVFDTPISEASLGGMAVGAALSGLRPVLEIMFMDFTALCMDAIVNQAAKVHFMFGGQVSVPLVIRTPHGGGLNAGPQHSQCLEAWFAHVPGLKVVCPSDPADAYALLKASIADPDPVVFVENRALYATKGDVPTDVPPAVLGQALVRRGGADVTVVSYGAAVHQAISAAEAASVDGISVEVVDLRTLQPWDERTVLASLRKTNRLVIAHEAVEAFGVGAEIAARMADVGFDDLDGPIVRVGAPSMPVPFSRELEVRYLPDAARISAAIRRVLE